MYSLPKQIQVLRNKDKIFKTKLYPAHTHTCFSRLSWFLPEQGTPGYLPYLEQHRGTEYVRLRSVRNSSFLLLLPPHTSPAPVRGPSHGIQYFRIRLLLHGLSTDCRSSRKCLPAPVWGPPWVVVWISAPLWSSQWAAGKHLLWCL